MTLVLRYSARSDRGLVRQNNQDAVYAGPRLLALADGMGGHAAGEVASARWSSRRWPRSTTTSPATTCCGELRAATVEGNAAITGTCGGDPTWRAWAPRSPRSCSRARGWAWCTSATPAPTMLRDGAFTQITQDDTFVQSLIDEGRITEEEAHTHPQRSLLLRAMTGQEVEPSLTVREARPGDRYLLCSDGLSGVVSDETLAETT